MNEWMSGQASGALLFVLLIALPLAFVISLILRALYLGAVKRSMMKSVGHTAEAAPAPASAPLPSFDARALARRALGRPWALAAIYGLGGLAFASTMAIAALIQDGLEILPGRFTALAILHTWPAALAIGLAAAATWRGWALILAIYLGVFAGFTYMMIPHGASYATSALALAMLAIPGTLAVLIMLARPVRAMGPLVLALAIAALSGALIFAMAAFRDEASIRQIIALTAPLGWGAVEIFAGVQIIGALVLGAVGWLLLGLLGRAYSRGATSDQAIMLDSIFLIFTMVEGATLASKNVFWFFAAFGAFAAYKIVTLIGFALIRPPRDLVAPKLLLLRVFSLGKRSEKLFDAFGKSWRHAGSIRMIAGPDLATSTIEPHEFLNFLSGRLSRRFIASSADLDRQLSETGARADPDGRYRVTDLFCHDDTWTMALSRLVEESDAVLMDLRGFTPTNKGCALEIEKLAHVAPMDRVVFVIDKTTDADFLRQCLVDAWASMAPSSPNAGTKAESVEPFVLKGGSVPQLVRRVAEAAA